MEAAAFHLKNSFGLCRTPLALHKFVNLAWDQACCHETAGDHFPNCRKQYLCPWGVFLLQTNKANVDRWRHSGGNCHTLASRCMAWTNINTHWAELRQKTKFPSWDAMSVVVRLKKRDHMPCTTLINKSFWYLIGRDDHENDWSFQDDMGSNNKVLTLLIIPMRTHPHDVRDSCTHCQHFLSLK